MKTTFLFAAICVVITIILVKCHVPTSVSVFLWLIFFGINAELYWDQIKLSRQGYKFLHFSWTNVPFLILMIWMGSIRNHLGEFDGGVWQPQLYLVVATLLIGMALGIRWFILGILKAIDKHQHAAYSVTDRVTMILEGVVLFLICLL